MVYTSADTHRSHHVEQSSGFGVGLLIYKAADAIETQDSQRGNETEGGDWF